MRAASTCRAPLSPGGSGGKATAFGILLGLILAALAVEVVLLIRQNRMLKAELARLHEELAAGSGMPSLRVGESVEPVELVSLHGEPTRISYDDPDLDTVLLIFSPDCPACSENMANWRALEAMLFPELDRVYYVSTMSVEETLAFVEENDITSTVLLSDDESLLDYRVTHTPMTLEIGPGGVVKNIWIGMLPEGASDTIARS